MLKFKCIDTVKMDNGTTIYSLIEKDVPAPARSITMMCSEPLAFGRDDEVGLTLITDGNPMPGPV